MKQGRRNINFNSIEHVARELNRMLDYCSVMTFAGPLGAGKTTFIRALLQQRGVKEPVTSPTFAYLNVYQGASGNTFYHFDLYRLAELDAFLQAGFDEYLYQPESWALIEWPGIIRSLLTCDVCDIYIDYHAHDQNKRILTWKCL